MTEKIVFAKGPLSPAGASHVIAWRDAEGFHRSYANGYASAAEARSAAIEGAKIAGYIEPRWWQFWKINMEQSAA